jgi:hypothetical protein
MNGKSNKIKFTLEQATKTQTGTRGITLLFFFNFVARWGWVVDATPRPLYTLERSGTLCTGGWVGPRSDLEGCGKVASTGIRSPSRPPRSESLYRLSYIIIIIIILIIIISLIKITLDRDSIISIATGY